MLTDRLPLVSEPEPYCRIISSIRVQGPDPEPKVNEKIPTGFTGIKVLGTAIAVILISTGGNT